MGCRKLWPNQELEIVRPKIFVPGMMPLRRRKFLPFMAPRMAIAGVQNTNGGSSAGSLFSFTRTFSSPVTALCLLTACVLTESGAGGPTGVTDSDGNTYTQAVSKTVSSLHCSIWYFANAAHTGSTNVVTVTTPNTNTIYMGIAEWSGVATTSPLDQISSASSSSTTTVSSGNATTASAGELYLGASIISNFPNPAGTATFTEEASWTALFNNNNFSTSGEGMLSEYLIGGAGGTFAATWAASSAVQHATCLATFKAAGGATGNLFRAADLSGLGAGGPFFQNPLG